MQPVPAFTVSLQDQSLLQTNRVSVRVTNGIGYIVCQGREYQIKLIDRQKNQVTLNQTDLEITCRMIAVLLIKKNLINSTDNLKSCTINQNGINGRFGDVPNPSQSSGSSSAPHPRYFFYPHTDVDRQVTRDDYDRLLKFIKTKIKTHTLVTKRLNTIPTSKQLPDLTIEIQEIQSNLSPKPPPLPSRPPPPPTVLYPQNRKVK